MHVSAAAAVICAMFVMVSCDKDDPLLPEVIESEVYDEGEAGEVTAQSGTEGTSLSYESWIMVRGITRASFDNRVAVTLNGLFEDVEKIHPINHWAIGEYQTFVTREFGASRQEDFVTVTDSVLLYTVRFDEFEFSYPLHYEVAVYDDGVTRQVMPYHYYGNIRDNGGVLEDADSYVDGDKAYARKIYRHSIMVDFGGESYEIKAEITLRREIGPAFEPYALRSEVVAKSIEQLPSADGFVSSITVKSVMSTGEETEETYTASLPALSNLITGDEITVYGSIDDLELQGTEVIETSRSFEEGGMYVTLERISENCVLHYNHFDLEIPFVRYAALFDNILLQEDMGGYAYDGQKVNVVNADWSFIEQNGEKKHYFLTLTIRMEIGELYIEGVYNGWFVFIE